MEASNKLQKFSLIRGRITDEKIYHCRAFFGACSCNERSCVCSHERRLKRQFKCSRNSRKRPSVTNGANNSDTTTGGTTGANGANGANGTNTATGGSVTGGTNNAGGNLTNKGSANVSENPRTSVALSLLPAAAVALKKR